MKTSKIILTLAVLCNIALSFAHPASDQTVTYDKSKGNLVVTFDHKVKDTGDHFIFDAKVMVNKRPVITQRMSRQENPNGGVLYYHVIDLKPGDKITVTTECSKGGKRSCSMDYK